MKAIWYEKAGPASEVLTAGETDDAPAPGKGEVRVRVATSGINPVDVKRRSGSRSPMPAPKVIPHNDGAGVIDRVGSGVPDSRLGERVWIYEAQWGRAFGTAAAYVTIPARRAVELPAGTDFAEGACLGIPAITAHFSVFADGPVSDETILVTGGAGAVGGYAIQFAKLEGAKVIATVSSDEKAAIASEYGADHVINYKTEDVAARVKEITGGEGIERIIEVEFGGNLKTALAVLKPNGFIATYASEAAPQPAIPFYEMLYGSVTVRFVVVFSMPESAKQGAVADISSWLASGELRHRIAERHPLEAATAAHEAVERGPLGKVLLDISDGTPVAAAPPELESQSLGSREEESAPLAVGEDDAVPSAGSEEVADPPTSSEEVTAPPARTEEESGPPAPAALQDKESEPVTPRDEEAEPLASRDEEDAPADPNQEESDPPATTDEEPGPTEPRD